jgi:uncharacterized protein YvpB
MSERRSRAATRRRTVMRRRLTALVALALVLVAVVVVVTGSGGSTRSAPDADPAMVRLELAGHVVAQAEAKALQRPRDLAVLLREVPLRRSVNRGAATIRFQVDRAGAGPAAARAAHNGGGTVTVSEQPVASRIRVPLVKQVLRDDCEAAALSMLLAYERKPVSQLTLQRRVAHSPPLDPQTAANGAEVWGDPSRGFVGRADGSGPAGGFGVYQGPIQALAKREGVTLGDLTGSSPEAVYRALLHGRPVMVWVALAEGPYASWQTLSGATVHVNWGEHAVVLTGVGPEGVHVNDPLSGTRLTWSKEQFEAMWRGLGSRALAA